MMYPIPRSQWGPRAEIKVKMTLRVDNGTLRIKLTDDPNHDLYLNRSIIKSACESLAPSLRDPSDADYKSGWDSSETIKGENGKEKRMFTLVLNVSDDTFLLEGSISMLSHRSIEWIH